MENGDGDGFGGPGYLKPVFLKLTIQGEMNKE